MSLPHPSSPQDSLWFDDNEKAPLRASQHSFWAHRNNWTLPKTKAQSGVPHGSSGRNGESVCSEESSPACRGLQWGLLQPGPRDTRGCKGAAAQAQHAVRAVEQGAQTPGCCKGCRAGRIDTTDPCLQHQENTCSTVSEALEIVLLFWWERKKRKKIQQEREEFLKIHHRLAQFDVASIVLSSFTSFFPPYLQLSYKTDIVIVLLQALEIRAC